MIIKVEAWRQWRLFSAFSIVWRMKLHKKRCLAFPKVKSGKSASTASTPPQIAHGFNYPLCI